LPSNAPPVKVLLVEDCGEIRRVFQAFLKLAVDIETEVLLASDGEEGVEVAQRERPDIVFLDVKMPVMDGIEAARRLKADERLKDVPVIIMSAHGDRIERQDEAEEAGVTLFVNKPFTPEEIEDAMRRALRL
jgi:two-component system cell cycle response regulator DivK